MKKTIIFLFIFLIFTNNVSAKETVKLSRCVDGDTIKVVLNKDIVTVRLIAIDTPESVKPDAEAAYYGKEASEYTCNRVTNAKKIQLEYDEKSDKYDKFDRLIAWVYVDNKLLQAELVEKGYAKVAYLYDDYKYADELKKYQELASAKGIGIWNEAAKQKYENNKEEPRETEDISKITDELENKEIIIIVISLLIMTLLGSKIIKK